MPTSKSNNERSKDTNNPILPVEHEDTEQHLEFGGDSKENTEASDAVNLPEHHVTKEEFEQRESGQASSSSIPPPDDAPRSL